MVILKNGSGYNSPPDLVITGDGNYARLTPIINNGQVIEVKVLNGGAGYIQDRTSIAIKAAGKNAVVDSKVRRWNINNVEKDINILKSDDGLIRPNLPNNSLQYCHAYIPRLLRESVYGITEERVMYGNPDLDRDSVTGFQRKRRFRQGYDRSAWQSGSHRHGTRGKAPQASDETGSWGRQHAQNLHTCSKGVPCSAHFVQTFKL
mgnify:CR=1 FL=1